MTLIEDPHEDDGQPCAEFGCTYKVKFDTIGRFWYHISTSLFDWASIPNHQPRPKTQEN